MRVEKVDFNDWEKAFLGLILNNEQKSGLEVAIWDYLKNERNYDSQRIIDESKKIYEEPFDSEKKNAMTIAEVGGKETAFIVGAPEIILFFCKITKKEKGEVLQKIEDWAGQGLRVLGVIYKDQGDLKEKSGFFYLGLIGIKDPIRPGAKEAIEIAQKAGIKVKIVTGDYRKTAERVASQVGLVLKPENILDGDDLDVISEEELKNRIDDILLFARVTPHEKMKIIKVLQEKGEIVAMTGDGINDAPALKNADIGIAVGNASDVAKETSDLILIDSNFKTIVAAVEEGRLIFSNIKKVVAYVLSNSFVEMVLILGAVVLDFPAPLTVIQILWIHLICDGPPDIALAFEPKDSSIMKESPKDIKQEGILSGSMMFLICAISLSTGLLALVLFKYFYRESGDLTLARTITFATAATVDLVYIFAFKNMKKLIIHTENFFQNKYLILSVIYGFILLFSAIYIPQINRLLGTIPLNLSHWGLVFGVSLVTVVITEAVKIIEKKRKYFRIEAD
jgi:Ca2+-transporting ATPase